MPTPWPTELRLAKNRRSLHVAFDDGAAFDLPAELLRVVSPSAEVQGHGQAEKKTVAGKIDVEILKILPTGNYAVRLVFDDLHDTGIYTWAYLREIGEGREAMWADYLKALAEKGLRRER
jgi:DUF971 family protein